VPAIARALGVAPLSMKAVLSSYTLSLAVFIPISGWMADRFGTRRVFSSAIALFTLGSFLCGISTNIHALVAFRILQGCGGAMMVPVGRITMVRTFAKSELIQAMAFVAIPGLIGPMLGPVAGGLIVGYLHWRMIFFVNMPIGLLGLYLVYRHMPDYREENTPPAGYPGPGPLRLRGGAALLCPRGIRRAYPRVADNAGAARPLRRIADRLRPAHDPHALPAAAPGLVPHPHLSRLGQRELFHPARHRRHPIPLSAAVPGWTWLSPIQSGLMMMPQALAAMSLKLTMPQILRRFGHRNVLISNTVILGLLIMLFGTIDASTPVWLIVIQAFTFGFFTSLPIHQHEHPCVTRT